MNQVQFLGLAHTFATVSPGNVQSTPNPLKKGTDTQVEIKNIFTVVREMLRFNYQSRNRIGPYHFLGNKPKKFDFVHQTISCREARAGWAQD